MGYPGLELDQAGDEINGFVFKSQNLADHWASLDTFEGEAYSRVLTTVELKNGITAEVHIYVLQSP
jgi:gamma-glutamylcyclotransferase (GGCT)/AIG2-like uncharacterized protein YtfP